MQANAPSRILRSALMVIGIGGSVAAALAFGAWQLLPYEALEAQTAVQRFALWEGVMWGLGLAGALFGLAALFNATDLYGANTVEHVHQLAQDARRGRTLYSDLPAIPWLLLASGVALLLIAVLTRSVALG